MMFHHDGLRTITAENARAAHITGQPLLIYLLRPFVDLFSDLVFSDPGGFTLILSPTITVSVYPFILLEHLMRQHQKIIN